MDAPPPVEKRIALDLARHGLLVAPAVVLVAGLFGGIDGAASATRNMGCVPSRSSSHQPNAANSTGMAANSNAWASASPKPRLRCRASAQRLSRCPSAPGCAVTPRAPLAPRPPLELVNVITM